MANFTFEDSDQLVKERREGDETAKQTALVGAVAFTVVTWRTVLGNGISGAGWFALHPPLQTLAVLCFTYGILTLQPTNQAKTKAAGLRRHQAAIVFVGVPCILLGTFAVWYNKILNARSHFVSWHGTIGIISVFWLLFQGFLGAGSVWYNGALFGGGLQAKAVWKYHRVSGYVLFPLLLLSINLGGWWSFWGGENVPGLIGFLVYTAAPAAIGFGVYHRVRLFKMPIF